MLSKVIWVKQQTCGLCYDVYWPLLNLSKCSLDQGRSGKSMPSVCRGERVERRAGHSIPYLWCKHLRSWGWGTWIWGQVGLQIEALSKINEQAGEWRKGRRGGGRGVVERDYYECLSSGQLENLLEGISEIFEGVFPIHRAWGSAF